MKQRAEGGQAADETRDLEKTPEESARTGQAGKILDNSYTRTHRLTHLSCQRVLRLRAQIFDPGCSSVFNLFWSVSVIKSYGKQCVKVALARTSHSRPALRLS